MKKLFSVFLIVAVLSLIAVPVFAQVQAKPVASAVSVVQVQEEPPVPANPVSIPVDLEGLIKLGVIFFVTQGLKSISQRAGKDITGWASAISASLVSSIVLFFNSLLSLVPQNGQPLATAILSLLVTIFAAFGVHATYKGLKTK